MSAYLVDPKQIGIIAAFTEKADILKYAPCHGLNISTGVEAAEFLAIGNIISIETRHPGEDAANQFLDIDNAEYIEQAKNETKRALISSQLRSSGYIAKLADNLEYQSCEFDEYYASPAYTVLTALRKHLARSLPDYDSSPWGLD